MSRPVANVSCRLAQSLAVRHGSCGVGSDLLFVRIAFGRAHGRELLDTQGRFLGSGGIFFGGRVQCARLERWHLRSLMEHSLNTLW